MTFGEWMKLKSLSLYGKFELMSFQSQLIRLIRLNRNSTGPRSWFDGIVILLHRLFFEDTGRGNKKGMLIFCKDFDKSVENVRNKKTINAPGVHTIIAPMETEMHGASEFWKFPAIGEQSIKEQKARGYTLIGAWLMSDGVWLRVVNDDFEFDVARQICERFLATRGRDETRPKQGMLIFCKDFDKSVENVRNKKPINARVVSVLKARMETEMHGESEFWKLPAIGDEQSIKEEKAQGFTLIGALLMSDGVWLRVINDDFEFDVARQICEQATFGYLNVKREVDRG